MQAILMAAILLFDWVRHLCYRAIVFFDNFFEACDEHYWKVRVKLTGHIVTTPIIPEQELWKWLDDETKGGYRLIDVTDGTRKYIWWFSKKNDAISFKLRWG